EFRRVKLRYNNEKFKEKKGITPKQIVDLKGLMGDSADNYPGVKGIGEKTALKLLGEYGTIENIIENMDQLSKGIQTKIRTDLDMLHLSRELAEIKCDVPISCTLEEAIWQYDKNRIEDKFNELEFKRLAELI